MGRIDVVVFPNGGREVFGQIASDPPVSPAALSALVAAHVGGMQVDRPTKFAGYYDAHDASDISWQPYDENNPIVMVPIEPDPEEADEAEFGPVEAAFAPMELAQVPEAQRVLLINPSI